MLHWYKEVLRKYAQFSGRARRKEFWMFQLVNVLLVFALVAIGIVAMTALGEDAGAVVFGGVYVLYLLYALAITIPSIAVSVRRLHDTGRSGWWYLLSLVPLVNLALLFFYIQEGEYGPNEYGYDPKQDGELGARVDELYEGGGGY